ncbi:MAG: hypothetical protein KBG28_11150 [Kofleriaceae bacterium]|jgi:hypothetical protein|nr:hypothetical protein [Kofleriaceae bacterium]MBP6838572.1 hypothetical protein [Kofleriaceae bacterium]MBP9204515.1 hypothetical protein [Kofleriaceae bacterium]
MTRPLASSLARLARPAPGSARRRALGAMLVLAPAAMTASLAQVGCSSLECAEGTIERDGVCAPANGQPGAATCGPGTQLGAGGLCEPILPPAVCDPATTEEILDPETGVITCQGTGGAGCAGDLPDCATAPPGSMTLCGRFVDLQSDVPVQAPSATGAQCVASTATGPCSLAIAAYNAIAFATNPLGATPLPTAETYIDDCGRFRLREVMVQASVPFVGLGVDDSPTSGADNVRLTGVALPRADATAVRNIVAYTTQIATDMAWTTSAGLTGGTFAEQGVYVNLFRRAGTTADPLAGMPIPGVQITRSGAVVAGDDYYFSDTSPGGRLTVDPAQDATGANGVGLMLRSTLGAHSGTGGIPASCQFATNNGASIPGVVFVQIKPAGDAPGMTCTFP